jgi:hypothetical protein
MSNLEKKHLIENQIFDLLNPLFEDDLVKKIDGTLVNDRCRRDHTKQEICELAEKIKKIINNNPEFIFLANFHCSESDSLELREAHAQHRVIAFGDARASVLVGNRFFKTPMIIWKKALKVA